MRNNIDRKQKRQFGVRQKIRHISKRPRLSVFRSSKYIYAQIIDDKTMKTIIGVSEKMLANEKDSKKTDRAKKLGILMAKAAIAKKIKQVVLDRGGYAYHGRVKAFAEGAREGGLEF